MSADLSWAHWICSECTWQSVGDRTGGRHEARTGHCVVYFLPTEAGEATS